VSVDPDLPGTRTLVVVPTYDEAGTVAATVAGVRRAAPAADVLVVDDASPDGTGDLAAGLAAVDEQVHVLHRADKEGLGAAYRDGFGWGLVRGYDRFVQMDADGSHRPDQLPDLLAALRPGVGLVLGSRWVPGGEVVDWPRHRVLLSRGGNAYARHALGVAVRDMTGGFRVWARGTLETIGVDTVQSQGYCFQVDLLRRTWEAGVRVVEVPISFVERRHGESKMSLSIVVEALWRVTRWGVDHHLRAGHAQSRGR